jgi:hypothetical protein
VNYIQKKILLAWSKFRFLRLPIEKRVRLEVTTDGRHITFLLVSLYEAGYGVQVFGSQFVFRELMLLRKTARIPFLYGGKERECGISISDKSGFNHRGHGEHGGGKRVLLDYNFFSGLNKGGASHGGTANTEVGEDRGKNESRENFNHGLHEYTLIEAEQAGQRLAGQAGAEFSNLFTSQLAQDSENTAPEALRMPYFMHPSIYHRGLHKRRSPSTALDSRLSTLDSAAKQRRRFRIGFFGTHDREFYTQHYHFPGMNRFEILKVFLQKFGDRITPLRGFPRDWDSCEMAVSIDSRGGDRKGKSFLPQEHYFAALRECDFVLSPPGICTPLSHNLIEAMFCGAIPITNAGAFMAQPLENGKNCLSFSGETDLIAAIVRALTMSEQEVGKMREVVLNYYNNNLHPNAFCEQLGSKAFDQIFVNTEEKSVPFVYQEFIWPPHNQ